MTEAPLELYRTKYRPDARGLVDRVPAPPRGRGCVGSLAARPSLGSLGRSKATAHSLLPPPAVSGSTGPTGPIIGLVMVIGG